MVVWITSEHSTKERTAGAEHHLVCLNLLVLARQRHVEKVLLIAHLSQRVANIVVEVIPPQHEVVLCHFPTATRCEEK